MATLRDIKNRIVGVKSTQKITKAMKMIATAKLRGAQQRIVGARPYANKIGEMLSRLAADDSLQTNPFFTLRTSKKVCVVIITADRGLCGAFNTNINKEASNLISEELKNDSDISVYTVGKKATEYFGRRNFKLQGKMTGLFGLLEYHSTLQLYNDLIPKYLNGEIDKIVLVYNEFVSMIQQRIVRVQLLPVPFISENNDDKVSSNYIYEPGQLSIFESLIPKHLKVQIWRSLLESNAAELSARMTAMDNATTNAQELIRSLNLTYNKERQASITKEILEIVSGANALKSSS
ncbi:MAG: ATP synthase gamma chain [Ignavibacteriaceae bacterium]|jgi:F-type H+-transporting ATPase subunit gamma|nr:ATP synthase gamma chain [Ignavibacteriaceae bacterium]